MKHTECPRCKSDFYISVPESKIFCPFCGYSFVQNELLNRREAVRKVVQKECILSNGFGRIITQIVDISSTGLGVIIDGAIPFDKADKLHTFTDIEESLAQVIWIKSLNDITSRAGLKFC